MGSAQSARGTQLGGRGRPASRADGPRATVPGVRTRPPSGAFPPRWCAATGSCDGREACGPRWPAVLAGGRCYRARARLRPTQGRGRSTSVPPSALGRWGGAPRPRRGCRPVADCSQCAPTASRRRVGCGPRYRHTGSAAMTATHPTRLETRTKESNARASLRVQRNPAAQ